MLEHSTWRAPVLAAGAVALAMAGCGYSKSKSGSTEGKSSPSGGGGYNEPSGGSSAAAGQKVKLEADEDGGLYFKPKKLTAKAGTVTLVMMNPKTTGKEHGIAVEGNGVDKDGPGVAPGATSSISADLKPGTYEFYCPVDGHKAAGMKGTLTVK